MEYFRAFPQFQICYYTTGKYSAVTCSTHNMEEEKRKKHVYVRGEMRFNEF